MSSSYKENKKWRLKNRAKRNAERLRYYNKHRLNKVNVGAVWVERECRMVLEHRYTDVELSRLLGRTVQSIQALRCKLKKQEKEKTCG